MKYLIVLLMLNGCGVHTTSHSLIDRDNKKHKYYTDTFNIIKPKNYYCANHYRWEKVSMVRNVDGIKYIVR